MTIASRVLIVTLVLLLSGLQYRLWVGEGSFANVSALRASIDQQRRENVLLKKRNQGLETRILEYKHGLDSVEEQARNQLGLIKKGETFYLLAQDSY